MPEGHVTDGAGTHFSCFTGTKVQILTLLEAQGKMTRDGKEIKDEPEDEGGTRQKGGEPERGGGRGRERERVCM